MIFTSLVPSCYILFILAKRPHNNKWLNRIVPVRLGLALRINDACLCHACISFMRHVAGVSSGLVISFTIAKLLLEFAVTWQVFILWTLLGVVLIVGFVRSFPLVMQTRNELKKLVKWCEKVWQDSKRQSASNGQQGLFAAAQSVPAIVYSRQWIDDMFHGWDYVIVHTTGGIPWHIMAKRPSQCYMCITILLCALIKGSHTATHENRWKTNLASKNSSLG